MAQLTQTIRRGTLAVAATVSCTAGLLAWSPPEAAAAELFPVSTAADGTPGSLRAAIDQANGAAEAGTVHLDGGTYTLDVCGADEEANASGDLDHTSAQPLTIEGNGSTIVQTCADQRVIQKFSGPLTIRDVTIAGGEATLTGTHVLGGQVYAQTATLDGVDLPGTTVSASGADFVLGGVVYADAELRLGDVSVGDVEVSGANVQGGAFWAGAELAATGVTVGGVSITLPDGGEVEGGVLWTSGFLGAFGLEVSGTTIAGGAQAVVTGGVAMAGGSTNANAFVAAGTTIGLGDQSEVLGGVLAAPFDATVVASEITGTTISAPRLELAGGAVAVGGDALLGDVLVHGSEVVLSGAGNHVLGGALRVDGDADVTGLTVADTQVRSGTGAALHGGATSIGGSLTAAATQVTGTLVELADGGGVRGGAILVEGAVDARDLTIARTDASSGPGGTARGVGALFVLGGHLVNATISDNLHTSLDPAGAPVDAAGGGLATEGALTTEFVTLAANGFVGASGAGANLLLDADAVLFATVLADPVGGDACGGSGAVSSTWSHSTDDSCSLGGAGDVEDGADPLLAGLADDGGATLTRTPAAGSPLVDRFTAADDPRCTGVDQRSLARPQDGACEVGAVERPAATPASPPSAPSTNPPPPGAAPAATPVAATASYAG